ncbi:MAG: UDP-2,3-diacylglucosamine diphosphatase [Cyclobacteriaceae bacterium]
MAEEPVESLSFKLSKGEKIYFASDFHLGTPDRKSSLERELKIVRWLTEISGDAKAIFLVGDLFDFWFEYKHTIPKGFIRFLGKLAELRDRNIPIFFFTGNHDLWMFDYFPSELGIPVYSRPVSFQVNDKNIYVGHGDGLGPGDSFYKFLKGVFSNKLSQWLFHRIHPNTGVGIAKYWSKRSRISSEDQEDQFLGDKEVLLQYCRSVEINNHHDYYIFGHRHLPLETEVTKNSKYFNLGEWVNHFTYLELDENEASLKSFDT